MGLASNISYNWFYGVAIRLEECTGLGTLGFFISDMYETGFAGRKPSSCTLDITRCATEEVELGARQSSLLRFIVWFFGCYWGGSVDSRHDIRILPLEKIESLPSATGTSIYSFQSTRLTQKSEML
jgi:hypothetical protein